MRGTLSSPAWGNVHAAPRAAAIDKWRIAKMQSTTPALVEIIIDGESQCYETLDQAFELAGHRCSHCGARMLGDVLFYNGDSYCSNACIESEAEQPESEPGPFGVDWRQLAVALASYVRRWSHA
jgi:hypothetical protein